MKRCIYIYCIYVGKSVMDCKEILKNINKYINIVLSEYVKVRKFLIFC